MNCPKCNAINPDDAVFCSECGARFENTPLPLYAPDTPPAPEQPYVPEQPGYQGYYNAGYGAPVPPQIPGDPTKNWAGVTGMIMGILSIVCCVVVYVSIPLAILGVVFGIIGLKSQKRGLAVAGIICGGIGLVVGVVMLIYSVYILQSGQFDDLLQQYESMLDNL